MPGHWSRHEGAPGTAPPWRDGSQGWRARDPAWRQKRRFLLGRLMVGFLFFTALILGGMALMAFLVTRFFGGGGQDIFIVWIGGCGLLFAIPVLMLAGGIRAYRRYATPLADVMAAADAVADGDLTVRVNEAGPGEFARLSRSFNRMTAELEQSDRLRRNLTADVAHELRNPLHIIQGNLEGMLDGIYEPSGEHIAATLDETRALTRLVEDLQTIAAAEAGQLTLITAPVDVRELLADLVTSFGPMAETAGITLSATTDGAADDLTVMGDVGRLDQVLTNLVTNALRHTETGGAVTLHAGPTVAGVRITVTDNGEGIPADDLPYVFERFWRGDPARSHRGGAGGGLGLAIARQLIEAHGGAIEVESEAGQGTRFVIDLASRNIQLTADSAD